MFSAKKNKLFYALTLVMAVNVLSMSASEPISNADMSFECIEYRWDPNDLPSSRNPPYLASYGQYYALKSNKYLEAWVDLDSGDEGILNFAGPVTITAVFQLSKQWPMQAALVSRWGFMPGEASYELGIMPDRSVYFKISPDGNYKDNVLQLTTNKKIKYEKPTVITAVFEPSKRISLFIDGKKSAETKKNIPFKLFNSSKPTELLPRFEGLLGGIRFYKKALKDREVVQISKELKSLLPTNAPYKQWKRLKRNVPRNPPYFLNTTEGVKLYKEIDISKYKGSYLCLGDLDNDSRVDFLLYKNGSSYTVPGRLVAVDHDGQTLWEIGDRTLQKHANSGKADVGQPGTTPALRSICTVFDIDGDGKTEVITELWENNTPMLCILDGKTGQVKCKINSPIDMSIRQPEVLGNRQTSRSHPVIRIARLNGRKEKPSIILKYGASNGLVCHAFALDDKLNILWQIKGTAHSMGHIPTVADIDDDGCDEIVLGHMLADNNGKVLWDKGFQFSWHADTTAVDQLIPAAGKQVLISVCGVGPVYCLNKEGKILWSKTREEIEHGQAVWTGNFIDDISGKEAIICASGHVGRFVTVKGEDGETITEFEHKKLMPAYPDFPAVVNWKSTDIQSLWIPQDRTLVDGRGKVVAELGEYDEYVQSKLHCGTSWRPVGAQAFAVDILGEQQDEIILYEPYQGESIFIFANPNSSMIEKPYVHQSNAYNIRTYF